MHKAVGSSLVVIALLIGGSVVASLIWPAPEPKLPVGEGLKATARWYREQGWL